MDNSRFIYIPSLLFTIVLIAAKNYIPVQVDDKWFNLFWMIFLVINLIVLSIYKHYTNPKSKFILLYISVTVLSVMLFVSYMMLYQYGQKQVEPMKQNPLGVSQILLFVLGYLGYKFILWGTILFKEKKQITG